MRYLNDLPVTVERIWYWTENTKRIQYTDVRVLGSDRLIKGVKAEDLSDEPKSPKTKAAPVHKTQVKSDTTKKKLVSFTKKGKSEKFELNSDEYSNFIKKNNLNEKMVENCLNGITKTHKGYTIKYI